MKALIGIVKVSHHFRGSKQLELLLKEFSNYALVKGDVLDMYVAYSGKFRPNDINEDTPEYEAIFEDVNGETKFKEFKEIQKI